MSTYKPNTPLSPASKEQKNTYKDVINKPKSGSPPIHYPFWFGGSAAAIAAIVTHPLDLVKVRMQTRAPDAPKSMLGTFGHVFKNEGLMGLYNGLSASLLRQLTYSTVRFGVYEDLKIRFAPEPTLDNPNPKPSTLNLVLQSSLAGFLGGIAGNPGDVLNVRMQSDFAKPPAERRNYKHAIDGLIRMIREEGPLSLFRGVEANASRALLMTASQLASYDLFKQFFLGMGMGDNITTHFSASLSAGFVATTVCSPVDVIKTRIMSGADKQSIAEIFRSATQKEGYLWMFRGWVPSFIRLGPHTIFTMIFFEQHKKLYRQWKGLD
ncbi:Mitochondrial dicarboxylate transporter [Lithohypha guttulata]|uniref:Mitochondrial dicarboxylate transporter n=1 Tax=Lithohypha guttulata TaxID=1690604 RepID=A0AAN7T263_9EURO|nr:Mitochondrial dicarboxylate transporter [Lithohypha guttulata]KAK5086539.1 Mitochondrial dicarboxylate transporter [Lithohypha guttulata]KAK5101693.1 Mitochondrial dicarboxylate transporter [Lithohypha guttulata]